MTTAMGRGMRHSFPWSALLPLPLLALAACGDDGAPSSDYEAPGARSGGAPAEDPVPGDRYEAVGTNPWTSTDHDPFSTFAADVDTASYDIFVRDATAGGLPAPDSVRLEEYVNAFEYDYPAPETDAEIPFAIHLAAADHPFRPGIAQLRVAIQASSPPEHVKLPTNLVFLVDVSGSMGSPDKLPLAQQVMRHTLDVLDANDTISIVTYSGTTRVALEPTPVSDRVRITTVINALEAGGGTAGGQGIQLAYEQAEAGFLEGGFNHVVLCTDGDFNIGISDDDALVALIEEKRETGVTLTALGFGTGNLNDAMMERVTNAGNGIYSVITSERHAERYATERLLHTAHHVAQDMKIQVELNADHVLAYRLLGYENRAIADDDFRDDTVDAGEIGAGHRVTALYELVLVGQSVPTAEEAPALVEGERFEGQRDVVASDLVRVRVRWRDLGAADEDPSHETAASLRPEDVRDALDPAADRDFAWAAAMAAFAEIVKQGPWGDTSHLDAIEAIVTAQAERDEDRADFARLFGAIRARL